MRGIAACCSALLATVLFVSVARAQVPTSRPAAPKTDAEIERALNRIVPDLRFQGIALEHALKFLAELNGVNINPNWAALEQLGITKSTEVSLQLRNVPARAALTETLSRAAGRSDTLAFAVHNVQVKVSTKEDLAKLELTRSHPAAALVRIARKAGGDAALIQALSLSLTDDDPLARTIRVDGNNIVVKNNPMAQAAVAELLKQLDEPIRGWVSTRTAPLLQRNVAEVRFAAIALENALNFLRDLQRMNVVINWGAMEQLGITKATEVTLSLKNVAFRMAVEELLAKAAGKNGVLDFEFAGDILRISTADDLARNTVVAVHDIRDLARGKDDKGIADLLDSIRKAVVPDTWAPVGNCDMKCLGGLLIVRQTIRGQDALAEKLASAKRRG